MNNHSNKVLEFNKIKETLASFAYTDLGVKKIKHLNAEIDLLIIKKKIKETTELKEIIQVNGSLPFERIEENNYLDKIDKVINLLPEEIIYIKRILILSRNLKDYSKSIQNISYPIIFSHFQSIIPLLDLENKISNIIDENGEILDSGSSNLLIIRKNILSSHNEIKKELTNLCYSAYRKILQDTIITIRNKRFVIPIKQEYSKNIKGIIQDESGSGATVFVEPFEVVEKNNYLQELFLEEKKEIHNILCNLTKQIKINKNNIINNLNSIVNLDIINAKVKLSCELKAFEPDINTNGIINIVNGRHPLLILNKVFNVVPVNISIGNNFNCLVISGPNAGGKTAALKMLGLFVLMVQSGIHIPSGEGTTIGIFDSVWALIGDDQDLEKNLSTFSSHILYIKYIIENLTCNSLVLMDELCADTDPEEGAYLAFAIIKYLQEKNCRVIVTTHFKFLKILVLTSEGMLNASADFDETTNKPTYKILMNSIGESKALHLAEELNLPSEITTQAKKFITSKVDILDSLFKTQKALEEEKEKFKNLSLTQEEKNFNLQKEINEYQYMYKHEFKNLVKDLKIKLQNIIKEQQINKNIKSASEKIKNFDQTVKEFSDSIKKDASFEIEDKKETTSFEEIQIGDIIKILDLDKMGEVIEKDEKHRTVKITSNNIKLIVSCDSLKKISSKNNVNNFKEENIQILLNENIVEINKINLIGLNADEARDKLIKFLDHAYIRHLSRVEIIHGHGQGILKKMVGELLSEISYVAGFHYAEYFEGGTGVTIVELENARKSRIWVCPGTDT